MRSASRSRMRPRAAAASRAQPGNAAAAAATARSTSAVPARATLAMTVPSCGLRSSKVAPSRASTNWPPMNRRSWMRRPWAVLLTATGVRQIWMGTEGSWPLEMSPGSSGSAFSQTSSMARLGA